MAGTGGDLDFNLLRGIAKNELIHLLEASPGPKDLVIEECLMKPLDKFAGMTLLKQHETEKIFKFDGSSQLPWSDTAEHRFYLIRPTMANTKIIADHVTADRKVDGDRRRFTVVFVPRKLYVCEAVLEEQGVYGDVNIQEFNPSFIPLESDLLSLELPEFFPTFYLDGTSQWVHTVARSLWHLQSLFGAVPRIIGIGKAAESVAKLLDTLSWELGEPKPTAQQPISHIFLLDRNLDYATVFLSCLSYESLLDETFGIRCALVEFPVEVSKSEKPLKYQLSNFDEVYSAIRDRHISRVHEFLATRTKLLQANYDKRHNMDKVSEMREFVANDLKILQQQHKALSLHIGAIETIIGRKSKVGFDEQLQWERDVLSGENLKEAVSFLEDCMCQQLPEFQVLALLCLFSLTQNGLGSKDYQCLRTQYLHAYGHKHLPTFYNLKKLGIIFEKDKPYQSLLGGVLSGSQIKLPSFQTMLKKLSLTPREEASQDTVADFSYLFNGAYSPALCKVVQQCLQFGFSKEDLSKTFLSVPIFSKENTLFPGAGKPVEPRIKKTILVYFLGGVTYAEMAAFRMIARSKGYRIVVAATHIINKHELLKVISEL